ncbi:transcription factor MYB124-like isoform X2 [Juglans microcarpa x Juglans regia]|uniref:transcription factor MYB124-like isoform X2 n=1 Tax=Juglans microcarpa x Juglans regia TaxID=2249226 RepID=UPI001B7F5641|nr:transcription factor MYB124-like isoform X2 [Juglans microcarpa x Juglans regia]
MHEMNKKTKKPPANEDSKKKERHIVTWNQEEDDILRQQICLHGTGNWTIIASKFKDKTTRQCRRRWYTYLNSDFKKGGWSPEEDILLCEAQKIFGNRWTEIAKVVSGRTDNAVKNRFSTLRKKRAKYEAQPKENSGSYINMNNKRVVSQNGFSTDGAETPAPSKKIRPTFIPDITENYTLRDGLRKQCGTMNQQLRAPFAVLAQNIHSVNNLADQHHVNDDKDHFNDAAQNDRIQGTYLKKDDPKIIALMQQAELLSSLALKVNTENTDQSLENAWKVLQDFLNRSKESDILTYRISDIDLQLEDINFSNSDEGSLPSWRQPDLCDESPGCSEYSTGSTLLSNIDGNKMEQAQVEICSLHQDIRTRPQSIHIGEYAVVGEFETGVTSGATTKQGIFMSCDEQVVNDGVVSASSSTEFGSPLQVTPLFRSLAAGIPSPKFSESERSFLLRTLGIESPSTDPFVNFSQPPSCKRSLLHSL